jgi:hypothetical protein
MAKLTPDEYTRERIQVIGKFIEDEIPVDWGFFLLVFPHGDKEGRANYISKSSRKEVLTMMKNFIERSEANPAAWMTHSDDSI